jgi:alpha-ketoglutarate-dependent taurine dioxygenase
MQTALIGDLDTAIRRRHRPPGPLPSVTIGSIKSHKTLPWLIEPESMAADLLTWLSMNRHEVQTRLAESGGILFRGFGIDSSERFESLIETVSGRLLDYSYRSTPRSVVSGRIYSSTEYPAHQNIPLHNENAYAHDWPMKIWFLSLQCASSGGETPIADSRRVYQRIPAEIRERFESKGVTYVRNYGSGFDLSWQTVFQTESRTGVEDFCRASGIEFEWLPEGRLRTRQSCQATARHPVTGEMVWFNQAHLFHISRLPIEVREAMFSVFAEDDLPRNVCYGDGSAISSADLDLISDAYEHEKVIFPWREGDVLLLDNMLTAHGRNPFTGKRQVVVGMAEHYSESQKL